MFSRFPRPRSGFLLVLSAAAFALPASARAQVARPAELDQLQPAVGCFPGNGGPNGDFDWVVRDGERFFFVSRGGNYVVRATLGADGKLTTLDADKHARRLQTGNLPSGVVMSRDGKRAYTNNELSTSMTALSLHLPMPCFGSGVMFGTGSPSGPSAVPARSRSGSGTPSTLRGVWHSPQ